MSIILTVFKTELYALLHTLANSAVDVATKQRKGGKAWEVRKLQVFE